MKFSVRTAEIKDSGSIAELSDQLGYRSGDQVTRERLAKILNHEDHCVFVALEGETVAGWIHGFYSRRVESDAFVEIGGLVVDTTFRKKGIGKLLVDETEKWARTRGCKKVRVRCNTIREETHIFYRRIGFEINKEQKIFDRKLK